MNLQECLEKAVKEFIYPVTPPTQEDIDFIVIPIMEAIKDRLEQKRDEFMGNQERIFEQLDAVEVIDEFLAETNHKDVTQK